MSAISPDLVTDILLRLPVKSLLRFRCLSTSFCSEIDSADFVNAHLNRSIQTRTGQKLIIFSSYVRASTDFYAADFEDDLKAAFFLNNPLKSQHRGTLVCGSCNGLILLGMIINFKLNRIDLALWNPFTRRYKKIPTCPVQTLPGYVWYVSIGLGHDSTLDDYKIVMISTVKDSHPIWVFSLKSSSWREIGDFQLAGDRDVWSMGGRFANGALFWDGEHDIIGFDIANEVFFKTQRLSGCGPCGPLVVLGGKLYISKLCAEHKDVEFYFCASYKGGEVASGSWRKEFTVEEEVMTRPLAFSKEGDSILLLTNKNEFVWYNFENKMKQRVEIPGMPQVMIKVPTYSCYVCLESLVSVGNNSAFDGAAEEVILHDKDLF